VSERSEGTKVDSTGLLDSVAQHLKATMPDKGYGAAADAAMRELGLDPNKEFRLWTEIRRALAKLCESNKVLDDKAGRWSDEDRNRNVPDPGGERDGILLHL